MQTGLVGEKVWLINDRTLTLTQLMYTYRHDHSDVKLKEQFIPKSKMQMFPLNHRALVQYQYRDAYMS